MQQKKYKKDKYLLSDQYERFSYPNPIDDIENEIKNNNLYINYDPKYFWNRLWPEKKFKKEGLNILVAGCGANQASILSYNNPGYSFTGVDISKESIKNNEKLIKKHNLKNLLLICEDFRLLNFDKKFDIIISTGVIHHLENPISALKYFEKNLKEDGVIVLMVYGKFQRYGLNQVKKVFNEINLNQDKDSIISSKKIINNLHPKHPANIFNFSKDINYDSGIIDLLLHKQEKFYSIEELLNELKQSNLILKNVYEEGLKHLTKFFTFNQNIINKIRLLDPDKKLKLAQIMNWKDGKIEVILCKKDNMKNSTHYSNLDVFNLYVKYSLDKSYEINDNILKINNKRTSSIISFNLPKDFNLDSLKILFNGQKLVKDIFDKNKNTSDLFIFLIENSLIDFSFHPFIK